MYAQDRWLKQISLKKIQAVEEASNIYDSEADIPKQWRDIRDKNFTLIEAIESVTEIVLLYTI